MKRLNKLTLASLLATALIGMAVSTQAEDQKPAATPAAPAPQRDKIPFHGRLAAVDKAAMTLTLEGKESQRIFQLTAETKLTKAGQPATLDDAVLGEEAAGSYKKTEDGKLMALSVRFGPKPEGEKPGRKTKAEKAMPDE
jgi:hypothetical protein